MTIESAPKMQARRKQQPKGPQRNAPGNMAHTGNIKPSEVNQKVIAAAETGNPHTLLVTIQQHLDHMNLVNLSTSIHRLAKCADKDPEGHLLVTQSKVFEDLLKAIFARLLHSKGLSCLHQCLSNVTWSLAHLYSGGKELVAMLAFLSTEYVSGFKPFELSMLLWGFAKLGVVDEMAQAVEALFQAASGRITSNISQFSFRSLAMITWAFATARQRDSRLFTGLANEMRRTVHSANCQEIGNTVWAFASVGHRDRKLLTAMSQAAIPLIKDFKAQEISNMLWGFATLGFWNESIFVASIEATMSMELGSQHLAIIMWACSKVMPKHSAMTALVERFAPLCVIRLGAFKPQEVSSTLQALVKVLLPSKEGTPEKSTLALASKAPFHEDVLVLLESLSQWVGMNAHALTPSSLANAVSSLIQLGDHADRRMDLLLQPVVIVRANSFAPTDMVTLLQAFLQGKSMAFSAISVLAAGLSQQLGCLHQRDLQALYQLYAQGGSSSEPSQEELFSWCMTLAAGLPYVAISGVKDEPEAEADADADAPEMEDLPEPESDSDSSPDSSQLDDEEDHEHCGSIERLETAESLPFLDWRPFDERK